jgi:homocysteine S-methyltransferase
MKIDYPLLLDGGLSNELERLGYDLNHQLWSARLLSSDPEAIILAHSNYLKAGAQCIITSGYQASIPGFMAAGHDRNGAEALILRTVQLAETAIARFMEGKDIYPRPLIAASIGPYGAYLSDGSEYRGQYGVSDATLREFHKGRIRILEGSNADILACETIPCIREARVLAKLLKESAKPAWISFSCKDGRHINDGTELAKCLEFLADHPNIFALGINCTAPRYMPSLINILKALPGSPNNWGMLQDRAGPH